MSYAVKIRKRAKEELAELPDEVIRQIDPKIKGLAEDPRPRGVKKLKGQEGDGWRIRVGHYRILYTIDDGRRVVTVYRIALRARVYRS